MPHALPTIVVAACLIAAANPGRAETEPLDMLRIPDQANILDSLKAAHPRLMLRDEDTARLRALVAADEIARRWHDQLRARADQMLEEPVASYDIPDGKRLLRMSRKVADRMLTLGLLWRIDRDRRYADGAWRDLEAAAGFPDWNPSHFLDTGEMTAAFAIAYDWMYDAWTDEQRRVIREAIVRHGLEEGLKVYRGDKGKRWWAESHHNWNQVCNGGMLAGALAIADERPQLAAEVVWHACRSLPTAMETFAPDGGWFEGPGYWSYAMRYNVLALACLESALGNDLGLSRIQGFDKSGDFFVQMRGTSGLSFNYADARPGRVHHAALFWLARRFDRPELAAYGLANGEGGVTDLIWYDPARARGDRSRLPTAAAFRGLEVAAARTNWTDPDALFVGVKAGRNGVNHDNLDLGSFVFDALGERWVIDLGPDDYNLPQYFGKLRYTYYRLRAEGHNTLVINPGRKQPDQNSPATCSITRCEQVGRSTEIETDLTPAYRGHGAEQIIRRFQLTPALLVVTDEITLEAPGEVWWFCHTDAQVRVAADGRSATLTRGRRSATLTLEAPAGGRLGLMPAQPLPTSPDPEGQNPNNGARLTNNAEGSRVRVGETPRWGQPDDRKAIRKLAIHLTDVREATLRVSIQPSR